MAQGAAQASTGYHHKLRVYLTVKTADLVNLQHSLPMTYM